MKLIALFVTAAAVLSYAAEDLSCVTELELPSPLSVLRGIRGNVNVTLVLDGSGQPESMSFKGWGVPAILNGTKLDQAAEQRIVEREAKFLVERGQYSKGCGGHVVQFHFVFGVLDDKPPQACWGGTIRFRPPNTFIVMTTPGMPLRLFHPPGK